MKLLLVALVGFIVAVHGLGSDEDWEMFKMKYEKKYDVGEELLRRNIWESNLKKIEEHNAGESTFTMAMNHLGDWTDDEYQGLLGAKNRPGRKHNGSTFLPPSNVRLPGTVDWRTKGYVTGVKNQGTCGSCWAFGSTGALEGQHFKKTGYLVSLSEQNLVDCSTPFGNHGCQWGYQNAAFSYIRANGGIDTEASYPYKDRVEKCHYSPSNVGATCTGFVDIPYGSEIDLQRSTATVGPITVDIDASHSSFRFYDGGVYDEPDCSSSQTDHVVLVVGYGTYEGSDYWLVKNSWGTGWGLGGYIMMSRNKNNQCAIASYASYPLV